MFAHKLLLCDLGTGGLPVRGCRYSVPDLHAIHRHAPCDAWMNCVQAICYQQLAYLRGFGGVAYNQGGDVCVILFPHRHFRQEEAISGCDTDAYTACSLAKGPRQRQSSCFHVRFPRSSASSFSEYARRPRLTWACYPLDVAHAHARVDVAHLSNYCASKRRSPSRRVRPTRSRYSQMGTANLRVVPSRSRISATVRPVPSASLSATRLRNSASASLCR